MSFECIRREEFDRCLPPPLGLHRLMVEQAERFSNTTHNIIGTIAGKSDKRSHFRVCRLGGDAHDLKAARSRFVWDLVAAEKTAEEITRQQRREAATSRRL